MVVDLYMQVKPINIYGKDRCTKDEGATVPIHPWYRETEEESVEKVEEIFHKILSRSSNSFTKGDHVCNCITVRMNKVSNNIRGNT